MRIKIFLPDSLLIFFFFFRTDLFYLCLNDCFIASRLRQYCIECLKVKNVKESEKQCNCSCLQPRTDGTCPRDPGSLPRLLQVQLVAFSVGFQFLPPPSAGPLDSQSYQLQGSSFLEVVPVAGQPNWCLGGLFLVIVSHLRRWENFLHSPLLSQISVSEQT